MSSSHSSRNTLCFRYAGHSTSMGEKISVISSMSSRNQSRPMAGPACSVPLIGTLAPPSSVAARARPMPVSASTFLRRNIAETTPNRIAPAITPWISRRIRCIG